eukprot:TRINITY_DN5841_c0_g1_i2.p1 TRINITY_DN5841_c0_g1~~TRINITY_DN5841_c0_g1_i2.p1  ORF type:complete len:905 (-),score=153.64 TRINITY_DN5841_c0_g1_i2:86-2800(-)
MAVAATPRVAGKECKVADRTPGRTLGPTAWALQRKARIEAAAARREQEELTEHHTFHPQLVTRGAARSPPDSPGFSRLVSAPAADAIAAETTAPSSRRLPRTTSKCSLGNGTELDEDLRPHRTSLKLRTQMILATKPACTSSPPPKCMSARCAGARPGVAGVAPTVSRELSVREDPPASIKAREGVPVGSSVLAKGSPKDRASEDPAACNDAASCSTANCASEEQDFASTATATDTAGEASGSVSLAPGPGALGEVGEAAAPDLIGCSEEAASLQPEPELADSSAEPRRAAGCEGPAAPSSPRAVVASVAATTPQRSSTLPGPEQRSSALLSWKRYLRQLADDMKTQKPPLPCSECASPSASASPSGKEVATSPTATEDDADASPSSARAPSSVSAWEASPSEGTGCSEQASQQQAGALQGPLAALLDLWKAKRCDAESISQEEKQALADVIFSTMPQGRVKIVRMERIQQCDLLGKFCEEERASQLREREQQKKHKEFMLLHGTRWEIVPVICAAGLDPDCGHLSKGIWLGQSAESAHSYAAKGPGPDLGPGRMLFAMFAVAACPNHAEGDEERSFGVWRIMAGSRIYPAYLVVYSAPLDVRVRRPYPSPRMNRSVEMLMQLRFGASGSCEDLHSPDLTRRTSSSPSRPRGRSLELMALRSPQVQSREGGAGRSSCSPPPKLPLSSKSPDAQEGETPRRMRSPRPPAGYPPPEDCGDRVRSPHRGQVQPGRGGAAELQRRSSLHNSEPPAVHSPRMMVQSPRLALGKPAVLPPRRDTSPNFRRGCPPGPSAASYSGPGTPQRPEHKVVASPVHCKSPAPQYSYAGAASSWEVQLDDRWVPLLPGTRLHDQAGSKQEVVNGQFWYRLIFDDSGTTGTQVNLSTGKSRSLRRAQASKAVAAANDS